MKKLIKNVLLSFVMSLVLGYSFAASVKTLNTDINISNISFSQAVSYWDSCLSESNNDDNLKKAYYVGDYIVPKFGYSYSSSNPNRARSVLDSTIMFVYNPGTFVNNGVFGLLSNMCPNGGNVKITKPNIDIQIVDNTVGRSNMAGLYVLGGKYQTMLLGSTNSSNFLGYRLDYFQNTPLYVNKNYSLVNSPVSRYSCAGYYVAKCGDGVIDNVNKSGDTATDGKYGVLVGGDIVQWASGSPQEVCDDGNLNGQEGHCNLTCDGYVNQVDAPTCEISTIDMNNGSYNVNWNISGTFDSPTQINVNPTNVNQSTYNVNTNIGTWTNLVPTGYGTYNVSMTVTNVGGTNTCSDTFVVTEQQMVCGDGHIDLPNTNGVDEQCDDGNLNNGDGCDSNCVLEMPTCSINASPTVQAYGLPVSFSANKQSWANYVSFDLDNGFILYNSSISFPYNYVYPNDGFYDTVLTVENGISLIAPNVLRPSNLCGVAAEVLAPEANLSIDKILLTTGQLVAGDFVDYQIILTNNGDVTYNDAYITDVMPVSLDLVSHNIVGVYPFTGSDWQDGSGNRYLEYSGFDLMPGQTATVNVRGQIRTGALSTETTNCAFTEGDTDCAIYSLAADPYILKSQMMSNNSMSTSFTTGAMNVSFDDYVTYRIDFANEGGSDTTGGVLVRDHMPLCVSYVSASIHGVSSSNFGQYQDINGRRILEYDGFDLDQGQAGYMIVTGQVIDQGICDNIDTYTNDSYIYFHNPLVERVSSVTANRSDQSIVKLTKTSDVNTNMPGDDKLFVVKVENLGPNPVSNIILEDVWPSGTCIDYVDWTGVGFTKDPLSLIWTNTGALLPGDSFMLYISGSIDNNSACVNPNYENVVNLKYTELGAVHDDTTNYHFAVSDTPVSNVSVIKTANISSAHSGDNIVYTISYQNVGNIALNSYTITDFWPGMVDFTSATPFPSSVVNLATGFILRWDFGTSLVPGQTGEIILEGTVN